MTIHWRQRSDQLTAVGRCYRRVAMPPRIWLRLNLPAHELASLQREFSNCEFLQGDDDALDSQWLAQVDAVFTEEALSEELIRRMDCLKWLHVTRGGVNVYLTESVKARPIAVSGSKGIHGAVFSEFALAAILMLAKKLPECIDSQQQKK